VKKVLLFFVILSSFSRAEDLEKVSFSGRLSGKVEYVEKEAMQYSPYFKDLVSAGELFIDSRIIRRSSYFDFFPERLIKEKKLVLDGNTVRCQETEKTRRNFSFLAFLMPIMVIVSVGLLKISKSNFYEYYWAIPVIIIPALCAVDRIDDLIALERGGEVLNVIISTVVFMVPFKVFIHPLLEFVFRLKN
jgi:hypothetical protein